MAFWRQWIFVGVIAVSPLFVSAQAAYNNLTRGVRFLDFNDYTNTATMWWHSGGSADPTGYFSKNRPLLTGTNHATKVIATNVLGSWQFYNTRLGSVARIPGAMAIPPVDMPPTASPYIATNLAANLQNTTDAYFVSPIFSDGVGTLYFEAINSLSTLRGNWGSRTP